MIRLEGTVTYDGGQTAEFRAGSAVLVAWEAYCRRQGIPAYDGNSPQTMAAFVAYTALGVREGFDVWLRTVVDVDLPEVEAEAAAVPPTLEGASRG